MSALFIAQDGETCVRAAHVSDLFVCTSRTCLFAYQSRRFIIMSALFIAHRTASVACGQLTSRTCLFAYLSRRFVIMSALFIAQEGESCVRAAHVSDLFVCTSRTCLFAYLSQRFIIMSALFIAQDGVKSCVRAAHVSDLPVHPGSCPHFSYLLRDQLNDSGYTAQWVWGEAQPGKSVCVLLAVMVATSNNYKTQEVCHRMMYSERGRGSARCNVITTLSPGLGMARTIYIICVVCGVWPYIWWNPAKINLTYLYIPYIHLFIIPWGYW